MRSLIKSVIPCTIILAALALPGNAAMAAVTQTSKAATTQTYKAAAVHKRVAPVARARTPARTVARTQYARAPQYGWSKSSGSYDFSSPSPTVDVDNSQSQAAIDASDAATQQVDQDTFAMDQSVNNTENMFDNGM